MSWEEIKQKYDGIRVSFISFSEIWFSSDVSHVTKPDMDSDGSMVIHSIEEIGETITVAYIP